MKTGAARRDARIRFLKAQVEILRRKLGGNRVVPSPGDRDRLLVISTVLNWWKMGKSGNADILDPRCDDLR